MKTSPLRDWELERYLLGELPEKRIREIEDQINADSILQERINALEQSNAEILQEHKPSVMTPEIVQRVEREKANIGERTKPITAKRLFYAVPAISSALLILFVLLFSPKENRNFSFPNGTRIKGTMNIDRSKPHLLIYKKKDKEADLLKDGDEVKAGDLLQIAYGSASIDYGVILSIDGSGVVTLHYPQNSADSALLGDQNIVLLSLAYELDEAPDYERFFFVTSESDIDVQSILDSANRLSQDKAKARFEKLQLSNSYRQYSVLLKKEINNE
ncbi:MAG: hypothetical protein MUP98_11395 [Candidatus Aminicenantes bacterium]|nr:hypothetical protein [Candidatus Aminicenantes bacterium]